MTIEAFLQEPSRPGHFVFRTEPPLTKEVFEYALKHLWGESRSDALAHSTGRFIVMRSTIPPKAQLDECARTLSQAEETIENQKQAAKQERALFLHEVVKATGLPVE